MLTLDHPRDRALSGFVRDVKARAQEVFAQEAQEVRQTMLSSSVASSMGYGGMEFGPSSVAASVGGHLHPGSAAMVFRQKRSSEPLRSLPDLLQNQQFFENLHAVACSILKAFSEKFIAASPMFNSGSEEIIEVHQQRQQQLYATAVHQRKLITFCQLGQLLWRYYSAKDSKYDEYYSDYDDDDDRLSTSSISSSLSMSRMLSVFNSRRSNRDNTKQRYREYEKAIQCIIYNVIVGNQIVIRGNGDMQLANDMCLLLSELVPQPCVNMCLESDEYKPSYMTNFLTVHEKVTVPESLVDFGGTLLIDVRNNNIENGLEMFRMRYDGPVYNTAFSVIVEGLFNQSYLKPLKSDLPSIATRSIGQQSSSSSSLFTSFTPNPTSSFVSSDMSSNSSAHYFNEESEIPRLHEMEQHVLRSAKLEWTNKARIVLRAMREFQMKQEPNSQQFIHKILRSMNVGNHDYRVLRHFGTGMKWKR